MSIRRRLAVTYCENNLTVMEIQISQGVVVGCNRKGGLDAELVLRWAELLQARTTMQGDTLA